MAPKSTADYFLHFQKNNNNKNKNIILKIYIKIQSKMSEDEEDYMSDAFLAKCIPEDVRPGLKRVSYKISYELFLAIYFLEYCKRF